MPRIIGTTQRQFFLLEVKLALLENETTATAPGPAPDEVARTIEEALVAKRALAGRDVRAASARPITFGRAMALWEALAESPAAPSIQSAAPPQQLPEDGVVMPATKRRKGTPLSGPMPVDDLDVRDYKPEPRQNCAPLPSFKEIALATAVLVEEKNAAYGDSFAQSGAVLRRIFPNGVKAEQYETLLAVTRILDKLFRLGTGLADEEDPARDITGYGLLMQKAAALRRLVK